MTVKKSPFLFNCHDLPRRAGEMREFELTITSPEELGLPLFKVEAESPIEVDLTISAVSEGVLATADVRASAIGECMRCLDPITLELDESFTELFYYEVRKSTSKRDGKELIVEDEDEALSMVGDEIDLELPIRDALILNLPLNPLCQPDCLGLCPDCGVKWEELPDGHEHPKVDIRWAGLEKLKDLGLPEGE